MEIRFTRHQLRCTRTYCCVLLVKPTLGVCQVSFHDTTCDVTLLHASLKAICGFTPSNPSESCALRASFLFWPSSCKRNVRERRCRVNVGHVGCASHRAAWPQRNVARPNTPQTLASGRDPRDQLRTAEEGEMNELFIKRKSSQA